MVTQGPYRRDQPTMIYYHIRHACGHAIYWENEAFGKQTKALPCPWCDGKAVAEVVDNMKPPLGVKAPDRFDGIRAKDGTLCVRNWHPERGGLPCREPDMQLAIVHEPEESCCAVRA